MMVAAPGKGQENRLAKREAFAGVARKMDELAVAAQDAFAIKGNFERTFALGAAMADLRDALDERVMTSIMKLQNTKLGFRTDMERGYPLHVVRDAVIEATVWGLQCVGNQFNIISGGFYATKEGYTYLLRNMPGLEDMRFVYHPAVISESSTSGTRKDGTQYQKIEREGKTLVDVSWVYMGKAESERLEFCIRVNAGMSQDAIMGKAERKAKKWLFERLTDRQLPDGEAEESYELRGANYEVVDTPEVEPVKRAGLKAAVPAKGSPVYRVPAGRPSAPEVTSTSEEVVEDGTGPSSPDGSAVAGRSSAPTELLHPELHGDDAVPVDWPECEPTWPEVLPLEEEK